MYALIIDYASIPAFVFLLCAPLCCGFCALFTSSVSCLSIFSLIGHFSFSWCSSFFAWAGCCAWDSKLCSSVLYVVVRMHRIDVIPVVSWLLCRTSIVVYVRSVLTSMACRCSNGSVVALLTSCLCHRRMRFRKWMLSFLSLHWWQPCNLLPLLLS